MRRVDWGRELNKYIVAGQERYRRNGFEWGRFDCVHFAGNWIQVATGQDPLAPFRGRYTSEAEALALLAGEHGDLEAALRATLGEPVHPSHAHRGDIAYSKTFNACGICFTAGARMLALFLGEGGFAEHRVRDVDLVFRVE